MTERSVISTDNAPSAIGTYSQAVKVGDTVYISGQIPLDPGTMEADTATFEAAAIRVFENLKAIAELSDSIKRDGNSGAASKSTTAWGTRVG